METRYDEMVTVLFPAKMATITLGVMGGIALMGSPLACLALELLIHSLVPFLISLPICVIGVYLLQTVSLRNGRTWI